MDDVVAQLFPTHRVPGIVTLVRQYAVGDFPWSREMGWTLAADLPAKDMYLPLAHDREGGRFFIHLYTTSEIQSLTEDGELLAATPWNMCSHLAFDSCHNRLFVQFTTPATTYVSLEFVDMSNRMDFGTRTSFATSATKTKKATTNCIVDANGRLLIALDGRPTVIDTDTGSVLSEWEDYSKIFRWISCDRDTVLSLDLDHFGQPRLHLRYFTSGIHIDAHFVRGDASYCIGRDDLTKSAIVSNHDGNTWAHDMAGKSWRLDSNTHGFHRAVSLADGRLVVLSLVGNTLNAKPLVIPTIPTLTIVESSCCVL